MLGAGSADGAQTCLSKFIIHSVSLEQVFGEIAVVGSHLGLSGQSRQGQSTIVSMDAGSLFGYSR